MLEILLGASGGIFGILGALVKQGIEAYQKKQDLQTQLAITKEQNAHDLAMADKQLAQMKFEADNNISLANIHLQGELEQLAATSLDKSFEYDKATYSNAPLDDRLIGVDVLRGRTRPLLTLFFSVALVMFTVYVWTAVPQSTINNPTFLSATFYKLVDSFIFLATTSVGWWFAASPSRKIGSGSSIQE